MPTVAILGASTDRSKFGNKSVRAHLAKGFTVYPINPKADEIEGLKAFASLADIPPGKLDRVSVYLPPAVGMKVLPEIAARGCDELWLNPGTESDELVADAERLGLNVIQACSIVDVGVSPHDLH
jgi:predicted CoA-binding protein